MNMPEADLQQKEETPDIVQVEPEEQKQDNIIADPEIKQHQTPVHQVELHKTSTEPQPKELREFLEKELANKFNKYCIDCKQNKTTHALIHLGTYVCQGCAQMHLEQIPGGSMSSCYLKDIFNEQWDDYQLKSIQLGANKALFDIQKEFNIQELPFQKRYTHAATLWYIKAHKAAMDGTVFTIQKPAKNMKERVDNAKVKMQAAKTKAAPVFAKAAEKAKAAGGAIKQKAGAAKEKVQEKMKERKDRKASEAGERNKSVEESAVDGAPAERVASTEDISKVEVQEENKEEEKKAE